MKLKNFLLFGLIFLFITSCGKKEEEVITIGVITPLTGEGATYGQATQRGVDLAIEEINNSGGINGKNMKVIYEDDKMNPMEGTKAIKKLIDVDKVPVIIGAFGSSITLAIAPIANQNKVVLFSASSTADALKDAGDYFFRSVPSNSVQGKSATEFAINILKAKTVAILYMNNDYGLSLTKSFEENFKNLGGKIIIKENYNPNDKNFRTQLLKIKNTKPDIIFYPGHYNESAQILKQAKEFNIKVPFIGGDGSYSPELISIAGNAAEGSYYTLMAMGYGIADEEMNKFVSAYKKKYNEEPDVYSAYAYDAIQIIANAIKNGGYSADGIKTALYKTKDFKGITGITSFDKNGEVNKSFYIYEIKNGNFELFK